MNSKQETWLIVTIAVAVLFGAAAGGVAGFAASSARLGLSAVWESLGSDGEMWSLHREENATIEVVASVASSVVSVLIQEKVNGEWVEIGGGTGVVVSSDGLVLTNRHVVDLPNGQFILIGSDEVEHTATLIDSDPFLDLAVLKFDQDAEAPYPAATLGDSDALQIGQTVIAIGNSLSEFPNSVTRGIISGLNRTIIAGGYFEEDAEVIDHAIQTDAAISEGNSGGPLLNLQGEVIGINTAVSYEGQSLGFAIPINAARSIISDIEEFGRVVRPWLGVRYMMIDRELRFAYDLAPEDGAYILPEEEGEESVIADSPAAKAGILPGDIILSVNGEFINERLPLGELINRFNPADVVTLTIEREGSQMEILVTLEEVDQSKL